MTCDCVAVKAIKLLLYGDFLGWKDSSDIREGGNCIFKWIARGQNQLGPVTQRKLSAAERQKQYRQRRDLDPMRRRAYLEGSRQRYRKRKLKLNQSAFGNQLL